MVVGMVVGTVVVGAGAVVAGMVVVGSGAVILSQWQSLNTASFGTGSAAVVTRPEHGSCRSSPPMMSEPVWRQLRGQMLRVPGAKVASSRWSIFVWISTCDRV